jgi:hypothetical protein
LSDPGYLAYKGFRVVDESETGINLLYLPRDTDCAVPHFILRGKTSLYENEHERHRKSGRIQPDGG